MNYIQILYLCILKQHSLRETCSLQGCELHSNLVSLHSETTITKNRYGHSVLWITFKSCIFAFWNNLTIHAGEDITVVNYIQILYLCILKQQFIAVETLDHCCELHSNLVSLHSETTKLNSITALTELWITFKSCIFAFWNNLFCNKSKSNMVVNYIQILYLCILKQRRKIYLTYRVCCELHSNLVSLHSETT